MNAPKYRQDPVKQQKAEDKKDDKALKEYLVKIKSNTLEDRRELDSIIVIRKNLADLCKKARRSILDKTEEQNLFPLMASGWAFTDSARPPISSLRSPDIRGRAFMRSPALAIARPRNSPSRWAQSGPVTPASSRPNS